MTDADENAAGSTASKRAAGRWDHTARRRSAAPRESMGRVVPTELLLHDEESPMEPRHPRALLLDVPHILHPEQGDESSEEPCRLDDAARSRSE